MAESGPLQVVDVQPHGATLKQSRTTTIARSRRLELVRLVILTGEEKATYITPGEIVLHVLEGRVALTAFGEEYELGASQLMYLPANTPHSLRGLNDSSVLLTVLLDKDHPDDRPVAREVHSPTSQERKPASDVVGGTGTHG